MEIERYRRGTEHRIIHSWMSVLSLLASL